MCVNEHLLVCCETDLEIVWNLLEKLFVGEKLGVHSDPGSIPTLPIIFCDIQVKGEYEWRRLVLDGRRGFNDYLIVVKML
ncbi:hypothetical protein Hanom_Chr10g00897681 [Helianthus anomalus]